MKKFENENENEIVEEDDVLDDLLFTEKALEKYPNEPIFFKDKFNSLILLNKPEKAKKILYERYDDFKGYIMIDVLYGKFLFNDDNINRRKDFFGDKFNPHEIYPKREAFTPAEMIEYFALQSLYFTEERDFEAARKMAFYAGEINSGGRLVSKNLYRKINKKENPLKYKIKRYFILGSTLLVAALIIWGIVALVQWIIGLF